METEICLWCEKAPTACLPTDPASAVNATVALGQRGSWLSTGTSDTNYQGLRWAYEVNNPHTGFTIEVRKSYIFEFKGVN